MGFAVVFLQLPNYLPSTYTGRRVPTIELSLSLLTIEEELRRVSTSTSCFPHSTIQTGDESGQALHAEGVMLNNEDFFCHPI